MKYITKWSSLHQTPTILQVQDVINHKSVTRILTPLKIVEHETLIQKPSKFWIINYCIKDFSTISILTSIPGQSSLGSTPMIKHTQNIISSVNYKGLSVFCGETNREDQNGIL